MSTLTATLEAFNRVKDTKDYDKTVHNPDGEVEIVSSSGKRLLRRVGVGK